MQYVQPLFKYVKVSSPLLWMIDDGASSVKQYLNFETKMCFQCGKISTTNNIQYMFLEFDWLVQVPLILNNGAKICNQSTEICNHGSEICNHNTGICNHSAKNCYHSAKICKHQEPIKSEIRNQEWKFT